MEIEIGRIISKHDTQRKMPLVSPGFFRRTWEKSLGKSRTSERFILFNWIRASNETFLNDSSKICWYFFFSFCLHNPTIHSWKQKIKFIFSTVVNEFAFDSRNFLSLKDVNKFCDEKKNFFFFCYSDTLSQSVDFGSIAWAIKTLFRRSTVTVHKRQK